jgi:hypothetical protein
VLDADSDRLLLYRNGKLLGSTPINDGMGNHFTRTSLAEQFNGLIDECQVFNYALSPEEIRSLNRGQVIPYAPGNHSDDQSCSVSLAWTAALSSGASYQIALAEGDSPLALSKPSRKWTSTEAHGTVDGLEENKTWQWQVTTLLPNGESIKSEVQSFKTGRNLIKGGAVPIKDLKSGLRQLTDESLAEKTYSFTCLAEGGEGKLKVELWAVAGAQTQLIGCNSFALDGRRQCLHAEWHVDARKRAALPAGAKLELRLIGDGGPGCTLAHATLMQRPLQVRGSAPRFTAKVIDLGAIKVGDNSFDLSLASRVQEDDGDALIFSGTELPPWITVQPGGRLFSCYGAPHLAIGRHSLQVMVEDSSGFSDVATVILTVVPPSLNLDAQGELTLPCWMAKIEPGPRQARVTETGALGYWYTKEVSATWNDVKLPPGRYEVAVTGGAPGSDAGSTLRVQVGANSVTGLVKDTGSHHNFQRFALGIVEVAPNSGLTVKIEAIKIKANSVMDLQSLSFRRLTTQ